MKVVFGPHQEKKNAFLLFTFCRDTAHDLLLWNPGLFPGDKDKTQGRHTIPDIPTLKLPALNVMYDCTHMHNTLEKHHEDYSNSAVCLKKNWKGPLTLDGDTWMNLDVSM